MKWLNRKSTGLFVLLLLSTGAAWSQCSCDHPPNQVPLEGGDNKLHWQSYRTLVTPAANEDALQKFCFVRRVENRSDRSITDISWKVADFRAPVVKAHAEVCNFENGYGEQLPHPTGPLNYGVGTDAFQTLVNAPQGGFNTTKKVDASELEKSAALTSAVSFTDANGAVTQVSFRSSVIASSDGVEYRYEVANSGTHPLIVNWQIPLTSDFRTLEISNQSPIRLAGKSMTLRTARSQDQVGVRTATVQIFDADRTWIATGSASAYCSMRGEVQALLDESSGRRQ